MTKTQQYARNVNTPVQVVFYQLIAQVVIVQRVELTITPLLIACVQVDSMMTGSNSNAKLA